MLLKINIRFVISSYVPIQVTKSQDKRIFIFKLPLSMKSYNYYGC